MKQKKITICLATAVACLLLLIAGCAELPEKTAPVALKFTPQDSATYKVTTESQQILKFEGSLSRERQFKGGRNVNKVEVTFTQETENIEDNGNVTARITIDSLKYTSIIKDKVNLEFDSTKDQSSPLAKLTGQSYTIELSPDGKLVKLVDAKDVRAAVQGPTSERKRALALFKDEVIELRHLVPALPETDNNRLRPGDSWSSVESFSFPILGAKSYERVYTMKEVQDQQGRQIAFIEMNALPTSKSAKQLHTEQVLNLFSDMSDNVYNYTGQLKFDLNTGKVQEYSERLNVEWIFIDPSLSEDDDKEPAGFRMGAIRSVKIEKID